jgi:hypothetical protein
MTQYKVWEQDVNGTWVKYDGTSKEEFEAVCAKLDEYNNQCLASKSPWGRKLYKEYFTEIIEDEPVVEEVEEVEIIEESSDVVEQSVEAVEASTEIKAQTVNHMTWNNTTKRYEAEIGNSLYCVDENVFAARFLKACKETTDDEYRIWGVLTWLEEWDFSGRQSGVYSI